MPYIYECIDWHISIEINKLWDGLEGKLTSSKYAKIDKCSSDTLTSII